MKNETKERNYIYKINSNSMLGITLIALVVTIVVMLILAGVTINLVFSPNGIIGKAKEAAEATKNAVEEDQNMLGGLNNVVDDLINGIGGGNSEPTVIPNAPKLGSGMTPIKWNGSKVETTTASDSEWYNYGEKKWANAQTSDGSMWVWIPRYAYQITSGYHKSGSDINSANPGLGAGTINVKFLKGTTNTPTDGSNITIANASGANNWNVHPSFTSNENNGGWSSELEGIWVAKFEASPEGATTDVANSQYDGIDKKLQVKPGVSSWRSIKVSNIYDVCKNYNSTLNSHMIKNSEWGAAAYLSKSKYGKETEEVWINNSSSFITGSAGNSASSSENIGTTNDYTSTQGVKASTTGNVYGIYDMSGGAWERVAGYVNNGHGNLQGYGSSLVNSTEMKTKEVYAVSNSSDDNTSNYTANSTKYGDAIWETSVRSSTDNDSWYADCSIFSSMSDPFFKRRRCLH